MEEQAGTPPIQAFADNKIPPAQQFKVEEADNNGPMLYNIKEENAEAEGIKESMEMVDSVQVTDEEEESFNATKTENEIMPPEGDYKAHKVETESFVKHSQEIRRKGAEEGKGDRLEFQGSRRMKGVKDRQGHVQEL